MARFRWNPAAPLEDRPPRISWRLVLGLFAVVLLLRFLYFYLDDVANDVTGTFLARALQEGTGTLASALLFPVAVLFERRFPIDSARWRRTWPAHVLGYVVYSVPHTTLMAASRAVLFPALGLGPYYYGRMPARFFMEASQDFFSYATFVAILALIRVQQRLRDREVREAQLERDTANAQLEALSLRLQPHFLFNALNTISSTVYDDPAAADELIGRLGDLLRLSLRTGARQEIAVAEELEVLQAYLALVEARFGERVRPTLDVDPATTALSVPAFLLQPLVENAVKHGTLLEYEHTEIVVTVVRRGASLELAVENDAGESEDIALRPGTGLSTTRDRLRLLYGNDQSLETTRSGGRFRVVVRLPARQATPALAAIDHTHGARAHR